MDISWTCPCDSCPVSLKRDQETQGKILKWKVKLKKKKKKTPDDAFGNSLPLGIEKISNIKSHDDN